MEHSTGGLQGPTKPSAGARLRRAVVSQNYSLNIIKFYIFVIVISTCSINRICVGQIIEYESNNN